MKNELADRFKTPDLPFSIKITTVNPPQEVVKAERAGALNAKFDCMFVFAVPGDNEKEKCKVWFNGCLAYRNRWDEPIQVRPAAYCEWNKAVKDAVVEALNADARVLEIVTPPTASGKVALIPEESHDLLRAVAYLVESGMDAAAIGVELGIPPIKAKLLMERAAAHVTVRDFDITDPDARRKLVQATLNKILAQGSGSDDPNVIRNALAAAKLIQDDLSGGKGNRRGPSTPDWDRVASKAVDVTELISREPS